MPEAIAEAVNGFEALEPRQVTLHEWRVLSYRRDDLHAYEVDLRELTCDCPDSDYNRSGSEVCDHIAVALHYASRQMDVGEAIKKEVLDSLMELDRHLQAVERRAAGVEADAAASSTANGSGASDGGQSSSVEDPIGAFEDWLEDHGLNPDDFSLSIDDQYGSLQIDQDGYLDNDDFSAWKSAKNDTPIRYDGDNDRNYLKSEDFEEVLA